MQKNAMKTDYFVKTSSYQTDNSTSPIMSLRHHWSWHSLIHPQGLLGGTLSRRPCPEPRIPISLPTQWYSPETNHAQPLTSLSQAHHGPTSWSCHQGGNPGLSCSWLRWRDGSWVSCPALMDPGESPALLKNIRASKLTLFQLLNLLATLWNNQNQGENWPSARMDEEPYSKPSAHAEQSI